MQPIYSFLNDLVGTIPEGFEPVAWLISAIILFFAMSSCYRIILSICRWLE